MCCVGTELMKQLMSNLDSKEGKAGGGVAYQDSFL